MKPKAKKIPTKRRKAKPILPSITETVASGIAQTPVVARQAFHKGNKLFAKAIEATGIPEGYSDTVSWFAERVVLATLLLVSLSFAGGVLFVLRLSQPIADSEFYDILATRAQLAQNGIKVYSQQIIDMASPIFGGLINDNREQRDLAAEELAVRKAKIKAYLQSKDSPFADDDATIEAFATSKNTKLMLAISFVESTFGKHCYYFNCSGIGGTPPTLRKYDSYAEWVRDFDDLLEQRYKGLAPEKFIGLYVQPGSPSWLYGVKQVIKEFEDQGIDNVEIPPITISQNK
jgi:hypothetical protein